MALPKYQLLANGAYQAGWDITLAGNYVMRQGFSAPSFILSDTDGAGDTIAPEKNGSWFRTSGRTACRPCTRSTRG